jgi:tubulin-specific chaperone A
MAASAPRKLGLKSRSASKEEPHLKALRIATGILKRTLKDNLYDQKECTKESDKLDSMKASSSEPHDIAKQEEILAECTASLERSRDKIVPATAELTALVTAVSGDDMESKQYVAAAEVLASAT